MYISILSFFAIIAKIINCIYSYYSVEVYDNITKSIFTNNSNDAYEYSFSKILLSILDIISNSIVNDIYLIYLFLINWLEFIIQKMVIVQVLTYPNDSKEKNKEKLLYYDLLISYFYIYNYWRIE